MSLENVCAKDGMGTSAKIGAMLHDILRVIISLHIAKFYTSSTEHYVLIIVTLVTVVTVIRVFHRLNTKITLQHR